MALFGMVRRFCMFGLGSSFAVMALLKLAIQLIFNPKLFRRVERSMPSCLTDKKFGEHGYVRTASNLKFHYVSKGDENKPLILFVHGFPEFWYSWRYQLSGLDMDDSRLVALDLRGYGDTDKPDGRKHYKTNLLVKDIKEFIEALGYSSCIVVAHDWGGALAWRFAHEYSQYVEKLIILNAPHPKVYQEVLDKNIGLKIKSLYMAFFQVPCVPELIMKANDMDALKESFRNTKMKKDLFTNEDVEAFKFTFGKPGAFTPPLNYYRNLLNEYEPLGSWSSKIPCPVLVIWGTGDVFLNEALADFDYLGKYIDNLTIRKIIGASHFVQQDEPALVNKYVKEFLAK